MKKLIGLALGLLGMVSSIPGFAADTMPQCPSAAQMKINQFTVYPEKDLGYYDAFGPNVSVNGGYWATAAGQINASSIANAIAAVQASGVSDKSPIELVSSAGDNGEQLVYFCIYHANVPGSAHAIAGAVYPAIERNTLVRMMSRFSS